VEVGVFTAWTCCIVSAYLSRTAAGDRGFAGYAVDVKIGNIAAGTLDLFKRLNITFEGRGTFDRRLKTSAPRAGAPAVDMAALMAASLRGMDTVSPVVAAAQPQFDACFIDGDHGCELRA